VQCVVGDLPETLGPVVAAPGKDLHRFIDEMDLHPVAVELDFVKPSLAGRDPLDGSRERGFNEARKRGLRANGGFRALKPVAVSSGCRSRRSLGYVQAPSRLRCRNEPGSSAQYPWKRR
jgi:hypothetical protein